MLGASTYVLAEVAANTDSAELRDQLVSKLEKELRENDNWGGRSGAAQGLGQASLVGCSLLQS